MDGADAGDRRATAPDDPGAGSAQDVEPGGLAKRVLRLIGRDLESLEGSPELEPKDRFALVQYLGVLTTAERDRRKEEKDLLSDLEGAERQRVEEIALALMAKAGKG